MERHVHKCTNFDHVFSFSLDIFFCSDRKYILFHFPEENLLQLFAKSNKVFQLLSFVAFRKRPTLEEVQNHRWLNAADYMYKKRGRANFNSNRIQVSQIKQNHFFPIENRKNTLLRHQPHFNYLFLFQKFAQEYHRSRQQMDIDSASFLSHML